MRRSLLVACLATPLLSLPSLAQNTSQLRENSWFSDDTRADGLGAQAGGTNLVGPLITDDPEGSASGVSAHDADIRRQIRFGEAPGMVPTGTHRGAVQLSIASGAGAGKSQISHRKTDAAGHAAGADAFGPATSVEYSWLGDGTPTVTASFKLGVQTTEFATTGASSRTGENAWDKVMIYEPGNGNGATSDGTWQTETIDFNNGRWWFFDRTRSQGSIGMPMTLSEMSTSTAIFQGTTTFQDIYDLLTAPGSIVSSVQFGVGSGNAGGNVYVNQLETSFYRPGQTTTFGAAALDCDQDVTSNVIFGSGNINGSFTTARVAGIEVGLRGKVRFNENNLPENTFNSGGDGTYTFRAGSPTAGASWVTPATPFWNFEWSINSDFDGSTGSNLDAFTYEIGVDYDEGPGTDYLVFDPLAAGSVLPYDPPFVVPFWDHAFGDNATPPMGGSTAVDVPSYLALVANNNLVQQSWNAEFFNEAPFDGFDPNLPGQYEIYLAVLSGGNEIARSQITIVVEAPVDFDQDITPDVIFGSGNANGAFTTTRQAGVELGLRTKLRFDASGVPQNIFNSGGDGTYTFLTGAPTTGAGWITPATPFWNLEWSVNTDYDGSSGWVLSDLTYEIGMDYEEGASTLSLVFDPISAPSTLPFDVPAVVPFWDHAIGNNTTVNGGGSGATTDVEYANLVDNNNVAQNSWNYEFFNEAPFDSFDPNLPGRYEIYLSAAQGGVEIARTGITVIVTDGTSLTLDAGPCQTDADCNLPGTQVAVDLWMRNVDTDLTGFQAFLAFDDSKLTFEGGASSYSSAPFDLHIQDMASADLGGGSLRLDGSVSFLGTPTDEDALLATLIFTVAAECDPTQVSFDLGQGFASEVSFQGTALPTALVDSSSFFGDATPPLLEAAPDLIQAADASVGSGCDSAVVTFASPAAIDTCSSASVACFPPSGSVFPVGTSTVTCVATDECGNFATDTFEVTVTPTNVVSVDVRLVGVTTSPVRCIRFVTGDCNLFADVELAFDATGRFVGDIEVPCGNWTSLCAKDPAHTLWDTVGLALSMDGTRYETVAQLELEGGDTDDDGDVDINDVTLLLFQFGQTVGAPTCPWDGTRDADFDNNGAVGTADYTFLTANWLNTSDCLCLGALPNDGPGDVRLRVRRVTHPWEARVDFDRNGLIDYRDVAIFEHRFGLGDDLSRAVR